MFDAERPNVRYDPLEDARKRWPRWQFREADLGGDSESIDFDRKVAQIDVAQWDGDRDRGWAHILAHLDHGHRDRRPWFTVLEEEIADGIARLRLDRSGDRAWMPQQ